MKPSISMRRSRTHRRLPALWAAGALLACTEATEPPASCTEDIVVSVATEAIPRITWTPECGVSELVVTTVPTAAPEEARTVWGFSVPEHSPIGPVVTYGTSPAKATEWTAPEPLVIGEVYRVRVAYTVGGDVLVAAGETTFTWYPPD